MEKRIAAINGLRGVAILAVLYQHFCWNLTPSGWHSFTVAGIRMLPFAALSNADQAVDLFFILSGLVLCLPYADERRRMVGVGNALSYYRRRAARLLPLLLGTIVVSILLHTGLDPRAGWNAFVDIASKTLWPFPQTRVQYLPTYNFVLWSLRVEIWLSILFPALLWCMQRLGAPIVALSVIALDTAIRIVGAASWTEGGQFLVQSFVGRADSFVLGMALAFALRRERTSLRSLTALVAGPVMVVASFWLADTSVLDHLPMLLPLWMLTLSIGFVVATGSLVARASWLSKAVCHPAFQIPGIMCYSIYLWHGIFFEILKPYSDPRIAALILLSTAGFSIMSYVALEGGSLSRLRETFDRPTGQPPTSVTSSSRSPALRKADQVSPPPSTSTDAIPWKSPTGTASAFQRSAQTNPLLTEAT